MDKFKIKKQLSEEHYKQACKFVGDDAPNYEEYKKQNAYAQFKKWLHLKSTIK